MEFLSSWGLYHIFQEYIKKTKKKKNRMKGRYFRHYDIRNEVKRKHTVRHFCASTLGIALTKEISINRHSTKKTNASEHTFTHIQNTHRRSHQSKVPCTLKIFAYPTYRMTRNEEKQRSTAIFNSIRTWIIPRKKRRYCPRASVCFDIFSVPHERGENCKGGRIEE